MDFWIIFLIALSLSADCFAVALGGSVSLKRLSFLPAARVSLSFGIFQGLMPVLGWLAGQTVVQLIADYDHWLAFVLLALVGGRMLRGAFRAPDSAGKKSDITRGFQLIILSVATSIDAFAVGLTFALVEIKIVLASATIAVVAFLATAVGLLLGRKIGGLMGKRAEAIGGLVLIGIGVKILLEHLL
ncbi:manganese efflux pump MntP family protein [Chloroflexota bacterium]